MFHCGEELSYFGEYFNIVVTARIKIILISYTVFSLRKESDVGRLQQQPHQAQLDRIYQDPKV